ncbi:MAG: right-handed parallel beta-helix repeat-containing protein [Planctomycetaceae bacterium]|nr:right-handed parallel beta-helix repeat-containing protein [Planctomycetaceae bacterium]
MNCRANSRLADAAILLAPAVTIFILANPLATFRSTRTIFVSPQGSDWNSGATATTAVATVQHAADLARPGDQIRIGPGTYYERVHLRCGGTEHAPVSLVAEIPGSVIITGELPSKVPADWIWRDEGNGLFSTAVRSPVYWLNDGAATCYRLPWGGVTALKKLTEKPGAQSAYCQENNRLFVYLTDGNHPQKEDLRTHRPAPAPREWGEFKSATVWVETDHIRLEGLQIEFGIGAAVNLWNAEHVEIRDCAFSGSTFGVKCGGGIKPSRHVTLMNCLYHNYPQYHWRKNWLTWDEVYAAYSSSALIASTDTPLTVENCLVTHAGDALRISPRVGQEPTSAIIDGNFLAHCTDDALEFDGDGAHVDVRNNIVYEAHQNLAFSPVEQGPIAVQNNLFAHEPAGINGAQIKLINNRPGDPIRNISVRNNVFVGDWLCWYNDAPINDVLIEHNRFFVHRLADPPWPSLGVTVGEGQVELQSVRQPPERMIGDWNRQANEPAWVRELLKRRPGPAWFPTEEHPATKDAMHWRDRLQNLLQTDVPGEHH